MANEDPASADLGQHSDQSPWNWLLLLPLIATLLVLPWVNQEHPDLAGIPFFYWYQLAAIAIGVGCTLIVYRMTRR